MCRGVHAHACCSVHAPCTFGAYTLARDPAVCLGNAPSASTPAACQTPEAEGRAWPTSKTRGMCAVSAVSHRCTIVATVVSCTTCPHSFTMSRASAPPREASVSHLAPRCASQRAVSNPRPPVPPEMRWRSLVAHLTNSKMTEECARRGTKCSFAISTVSCSTSEEPCAKARCAGPSTHITGSDASARTERDRPHDPACATPSNGTCAPVVSSHALSAGVLTVCTCTSASHCSSANRGDDAARHPCCVATATAIAAQSPLRSKVASSACDTRGQRRSHSKPWSSLMASTSVLTPPATSIWRHSVMYRWRCVGAFARSARDLKPSSCACACPDAAPSRTETASGPWRATAAHSSPGAPCSKASSTAKGKRVSPLPLKAVAALVHSASSRSAGWTCVPMCVRRARRRASASLGPPHALTKVRYTGPYCKRTVLKPSYSTATSAARERGRSDAWSTRCQPSSVATAPEQCIVASASDSLVRTSKRPFDTVHSTRNPVASVASGCKKYTPCIAVAPAARATSR
mmetsp:Transcript_61162/g.121027  ORF Transcript_61162/g.121027 Transcript_61162/m.121027 type:complete len:519 (+) Transcript_61162:7419-8975(+)